jgi:hypothetical protein
VKAFDKVLMKRYKNKVVTFINHSVTKHEDPSQSGPRRSKHSAKTREIPMPNEKFIALHATVGNVLHLSGGGSILETLLKEFYPTPRGVAEATWDGLALKISMMSL